MANFKNTAIKRKNPINRNKLFFSEDEYNLQINIGMEYINEIVNQTVVLYEVDLSKTKKDQIYYEPDFNDKNFKTPVEINVLYQLDKPELKTYNQSNLKGYYVNVGKLRFTVYERELENNECDIKRGDYIGLQVTPERMEYFIVTDDGRVNYDNAHTLYGTKPYYRTVECSIVSDKTETVNF